MKIYVFVIILLFVGCDEILNNDDSNNTFYKYNTPGWDKFELKIDDVSEIDSLRLWGKILLYSYELDSSEYSDYSLQPVEIEFDTTITTFPHTIEGYFESGRYSDYIRYHDYAEVRMEYSENVTRDAQFDIELVYYADALSTETGEQLPVEQLSAYSVELEHLNFPKYFIFNDDYGLRLY